MDKIKEITIKQSHAVIEGGKPSEIRVLGVVRGGYLYKGRFYYCDGRGWKSYKPNKKGE